ncbi:hypothetical protein SADUNF_Sadunf08G0044900 [Salix dunnii]|uniref:Uncharacterized protein n=1 Tax=Salix dunnii TaxID=1413687 RepID=A0A835N0Y8_9ROSI|nr:hypothetical protein SADUNF_Sadunf08G0044900 [Salix dunnii]
MSPYVKFMNYLSFFVDFFSHLTTVRYRKTSYFAWISRAEAFCAWKMVSGQTTVGMVSTDDGYFIPLCLLIPSHISYFGLEVAANWKFMDILLQNLNDCPCPHVYDFSVYEESSLGSFSKLLKHPCLNCVCKATTFRHC